VTFRTLIPHVRDTRGQALVEFAMSALITVALLLGVVEMSRMLITYTTVCNAARIGVRYAMVHGSDNSATVTQIQSVVDNYLSAAPIDTSSTTINVAYPSASSCKNPGCLVKVTISYPYHPIMTYVPLSVSLSSTSEGVITF
jgi:Flp pilus assembly protein TadG